MQARSDAEMMLGLRNFQFAEKDVRKAFIVVLTGMDEYFAVARRSAQDAAYGSRFDELGAGSDNRQYFHTELCATCTSNIRIQAPKLIRRQIWKLNGVFPAIMSSRSLHAVGAMM